ncbi:MAG: hypothetical protein ACFCUQ_22385 [Kiloniellales bacterium]
MQSDYRSQRPPDRRSTSLTGKRIHSFSVRVSDQERALIDKRAAQLGITPSEYVRLAVKEFPNGASAS